MSGFRHWRAVWILLFLVLAGVGIWLVWFSGALAIRDVRVVGVSGPAATEVLQVAEVRVGIPMARLDATSVMARITSLAWVGESEVRRGWPNTVVLAVTPRTAVALQADSGRAIDASGNVFDPPDAVPPGLMEIAASGVGLAAAVSAWLSLPTQLAATVTGISATTRDDIEFSLSSGAIVRWGSDAQTELKTEVLTALLPRNARFYDVSAPELPTTQDEQNR